MTRNGSLTPNNNRTTKNSQNSTPRLDANKVKNLRIAHYFKDEVPSEFISQICMKSQKTMEILGEKPPQNLSSEQISIFNKGDDLKKEMINADIVLEMASSKISPIRGGTKNVTENDVIKNMN